MNEIETNIQGYKIRKAKPGDEKILCDLIKELASYENLLDEVEATEDRIKDTIFEKHYAEVLIGEYDNVPISYALYFHNYSTFLTKPGLYLEDIYVKPEYRHLGIGKLYFQILAQIAVEKDCGRMEWTCLDWNEPSLKFYKKMGAEPKSEWIIHRVSGNALQELADGSI
ncbi:MAG: acetyltransferase, N-acetylglutamate synthase [Lachnospiraceae bacterium]|jgi:GNAT superfamily N-acetyltransferase|nr:acetyltransferase, N-acetylglutamate synthase [Lachnospiraceae bacterium]MDF2802369.1 acetyltransferase, N-acetylglutamate synthase [Anaerocolumna sp.]